MATNRKKYVEYFCRAVYVIENAQHLVISCHHDSFRFNNIFFSFNFKFIPGKLNSNIDLFMALVCHQVWKHLWLCIFFLSWLAAKSFITYLTLESFIPTSMLSIIILTMRLGVTLNVSEVPYVRIDTATWRHFPRHLVWFSHAFPLDSFSRTARTRSHVQCWQLSSLGKT